MDNYPEGSDNASAPWNAPCTDNAEGLALEQVCGADISLTTETLGEFLATVDEDRAPVLTKTPVLRGPISSAELLKLMLNRRNSDEIVAAATRELASRYLDCAYTRKVIGLELDRVLELQS